MKPTLPIVKPESAYTELVLNFLCSYHPLPDDLRDEITAESFQTTYRQGEYLLRQGEFCTALYFILKGIVVGYTMNDDKRLTTYICGEGDSVSSISGMYGEKPSEESILAMEDTVVIGLSVEKIVSLLETSIEMNIIIRKILESFYRSAHERSNMVRIGTAQEKYEYYVSVSPEHIGRVPTEYVADYLDINPKTLDRILKEHQSTNDKELLKERCDLIEDFIVKQQGFRQKGLTLSKMSAALDIPTHQLSYLINFNYKKSFNAFVNSYRVIYVRDQLQHYKEWQHLKIEALGVEGGFASRSVFFAEFKQHTGMSPAEYAKSIQLFSPAL
ncbi:cyclic nucleotide-binding domain-containing protein [Pedobacter frigoris]|uniref:Helix-turn-helix domain-containing protein n=1 Tax=Pedobacter frigoris TaxID=2571272 RepID=A0A4U1CAH2_9SPHI|nr:cyclic nucleotide-binding domain-containing protein [Pedobacter frigoris]TKC02817.1 helix-turn-helix domain-containing protein [Pedobacter frigoris]